MVNSTPIRIQNQNFNCIVKNVQLKYVPSEIISIWSHCISVTHTTPKKTSCLFRSKDNEYVTREINLKIYDLSFKITVVFHDSPFRFLENLNTVVRLRHLPPGSVGLSFFNPTIVFVTFAQFLNFPKPVEVNCTKLLTGILSGSALPV